MGVRPTRRAQRVLVWVVRVSRSKRGRLGIALVSAILSAIVFVLAGSHLREMGWPFSKADPALIVAAGLLFLAAYGFKAFGWGRLFAAHERPKPLALAAAGGGASVMGLALPGRFDEVVRVLIVRTSPGCRVGVGTICFSIFTLGLIDNVALAPLAAASAAFPGSSVAVRAGFAVVAAGGIAAAAIVFAMPRLSASKRLFRFRLARWLNARATPLRGASEAWALVVASWILRVTALALLLHALGLGFSIPLAIMFLCAAAASAALPVAVAGAATQVGAGATLLIVSGMKASEAIGFAVAAQILLILAGAAVLLLAAAWQTGVRLFGVRVAA